MTARAGKAKTRAPKSPEVPKPKASTAPPATLNKPKAPNALEVRQEAGERPEQTFARALLDPIVQAAGTIHGLETDGTDVASFAKELGGKVTAVQGNDMKSAEAILITQAYTLNELFHFLARRAQNVTNPGHFEMYYRIALRAQSQSRATLETLGGIKNPPVIYARQANVTTGPQQVNNGIPAHAGEKQIEPNKLLETADGQRMDTATQGAAIGRNPELVPVGEIHRPQDRVRKISG